VALLVALEAAVLVLQVDQVLRAKPIQAVAVAAALLTMWHLRAATAVQAS
jgi:hypothetical protein